MVDVKHMAPARKTWIDVNIGGDAMAPPGGTSCYSHRRTFRRLREACPGGTQDGQLLRQRRGNVADLLAHLYADLVRLSTAAFSPVVPTLLLGAR